MQPIEPRKCLGILARRPRVAADGNGSVARGDIGGRQRQFPRANRVHRLSLRRKRIAQFDQLRRRAAGPGVHGTVRPRHSEYGAADVELTTNVELAPFAVDQCRSRGILSPLRPMGISRPGNADRRFAQGRELHQMLAEADAVPAVRIPNPAIGSQIRIGSQRVAEPLEYGDAILLANMPSQATQHLDTGVDVFFAQANCRNQFRIGRAVLLCRQPCIESPLARFQVRIPFTAVNRPHVVAMCVISIRAARFHSGPPRGLVGEGIAQTELAEKVVEVLFRTAGINPQPTMSRIRIGPHFRLRHSRCDPQR